MGTRGLAADEWLAWSAGDPEVAEQLALKQVLLDQHHDEIAVSLGTPEVRTASLETAELIATAVGRPVPAHPADPLEAAALLIADDVCVLVHRDGAWRLDAGVVCFPSMWRLRDKLGLPLAEVHGPVPAYATELAARVDRFLDRLPADRGAWRRNWFIHDRPDLYLPAPVEPTETSEPAELTVSAAPTRVPEGLWLRSERQTLRRLPSTGSIVFTIRTQQVPLATVAESTDIAARMAKAIGAWSDELRAYRGARSWADEVVAWLEEISRRA